MIARRLVAVAAALLALSGCAEGATQFVPAAPDVDVDTPALRTLKAEIGMDNCTPGKGGGPVEGGLPEITLPCLGGGSEVDLSSLRGPMVLNFWAAWCAPCREEMPALQEFHETYGDQVAVLGVDFQDVHPKAALELAQETGATYPSVADPGGELMSERVFGNTLRGTPAFAIIDASGEVVGLSNGGLSEDGSIVPIHEVDQVVELVEAELGITLEGGRA